MARIEGLLHYQRQTPAVYKAIAIITIIAVAALAVVALCCLAFRFIPSGSGSSQPNGSDDQVWKSLNRVSEAQGLLQNFITLKQNTTNPRNPTCFAIKQDLEMKFYSEITLARFKEHIGEAHHQINRHEDLIRVIPDSYKNKGKIDFVIIDINGSGFIENFPSEQIPSLDAIKKIHQNYVFEKTIDLKEAKRQIQGIQARTQDTGSFEQKLEKDDQRIKTEGASISSEKRNIEEAKKQMQKTLTREQRLEFFRQTIKEHNLPSDLDSEAQISPEHLITNSLKRRLLLHKDLFIEGCKEPDQIQEICRQIIRSQTLLKQLPESDQGEVLKLLNNCKTAFILPPKPDSMDETSYEAYKDKHKGLKIALRMRFRMKLKNSNDKSLHDALADLKQSLSSFQ